jgi:hypothetical protein
MPKPIANLHVGGMIAGGFSVDGRYFLAVSHDGRGVYDCATWTKIARDDTPAYPEAGVSSGIGPIAGEMIAVVERGDSAHLAFTSVDRRWRITYEDGVAVVTRATDA